MRKRTPEIQLKAVVAQGLELLVVLVIADADDGQLGGLDGEEKVRDTTPVTR